MRIRNLFVPVVCAITLSACGTEQPDLVHETLSGMVLKTQYRDSNLRGDFWKATVTLDDGRRVLVQNTGLDYEKLNERVVKGDCIEITTTVPTLDEIDVRAEEVRVMARTRCDAEK